LSQVHGDEPNAEQEDDKPAIVKTHRNAEQVCNRDLAFVKLQYVHRKSFRSRTQLLQCRLRGGVLCVRRAGATAVPHTVATGRVRWQSVALPRLVQRGPALFAGSSAVLPMKRRRQSG